MSLQPYHFLAHFETKTNHKIFMERTKCILLVQRKRGGRSFLAPRQVFFNLSHTQLPNKTTLVQLQSLNSRGTSWPRLHGHTEASVAALTFSLAPVVHRSPSKRHADAAPKEERPCCLITAILSWDVGGWLGVKWLGHLLPSAMPLSLGWAAAVIDSLNRIAGNVRPLPRS
jgi:hypothetical protein